MFRHGEDLYLIGKADPDEIGEFIMITENQPILMGNLNCDKLPWSETTQFTTEKIRVNSC